MAKHGKAAPKLPIRQMVILAVARFAEPMAYTSVFPYLPQMIRDFGVEQNEVAKWAGITSAVFSLAQSMTAVPWGKASDRYGRKPTLLAGLLCTMTTFIIWGMSTSLPMAIVVRAIQGGGNGNVGIIRTMVAEMVPEKELQPRAFSLMPLVWSLGSVVGPSFGGSLAQPAKKFPALFGNIEFFKRFPYALPNLVATVFFLISASSAFLFLRETLPSKRGHRDPGILVGKRLARAFGRGQQPSQRRRSFVDGEATAPLIPSEVRPKPRQPHTAQSSPGYKEVFTYQTVLNLTSYTFLAFHSVAFDQNLNVFLDYPVMEHTPENTKLPFYFNGGFGLSSGQIGTLFAVYGIVCGLVQFIIYSPLVTRFGVLRCFQICAIILPIVYLLTPYTSLFPTHKGRIAALLVLMFMKAFAIIVAFPSTTILLTNSCSSLRVLGTLNGFATMFSGFGRAIGPFSTGWTFTWGAEHHYAVTSWYFLAIVAAIGAIPVFMIVEGEGPTASVENSDAEDSEGAESTSLLLPNESAVVDDEDELSSPEAPLIGGKKHQGNGYNTIQEGAR